MLPMLLLLAAVAPATMELRKCVAPGGATSYQTAPCAEGATEAWSQPVQAEPVRPAPRTAVGRLPVPRSAAGARATATARPSPRDQRRARCDKARREADELRDRQWNRLGFDERSALDARVARACRD